MVVLEYLGEMSNSYVSGLFSSNLEAAGYSFYVVDIDSFLPP